MQAKLGSKLTIPGKAFKYVKYHSPITYTVVGLGEVNRTFLAEMDLRDYLRCYGGLGKLYYHKQIKVFHTGDLIEESYKLLLIRDMKASHPHTQELRINYHLGPKDLDTATYEGEIHCAAEI